MPWVCLVLNIGKRWFLLFFMQVLQHLWNTYNEKTIISVDVLENCRIVNKCVTV